MGVEVEEEFLEDQVTIPVESLGYNIQTLGLSWLHPNREDGEVRVSQSESQHLVMIVRSGADMRESHAVHYTTDNSHNMHSNSNTVLLYNVIIRFR